MTVDPLSSGCFDLLQRGFLAAFALVLTVTVILTAVA